MAQQITRLFALTFSILMVQIGYGAALPLTGLPPGYIDSIREFLQSYMTLAREAVYKTPDPLPVFSVDPSVPMPVPFPAEGMVPPPGMAYSVLCIEGAGFSTLFFQKDIKGLGGHGWYEVYLSNGDKKAIGHNPKEGFSNKDFGVKGPKIVRMAYLVPEDKAQMAFNAAETFARSPSDYNLFHHNCVDTLEVAANMLGIPLPPFRTPTEGTAAPQWLYKQFLKSPYYEPYAHQESRLLNFWKNITNPSPELRQQYLEIWLSEEYDNPSLAPYFPRLSEVKDPFPSHLNEPRYGGIALNKRAELKIRSSDITGAVFDPLTGQIILIGQKKVQLPEMKLDDLAVALKSIYGLNGILPADPSVSIEPSPDKEQMSVVYSGHTYGTEFGLRLLQADATLKGLVLGKLSSHVPDYRSLPTILEFNRFLPEKDSSWRTWIVPSTIELDQSEKGDSMVFTQIQMLCYAETQKTNGSSYLQEFANHFTSHYDSFSGEYPVFQEIKRLAQITGVVKWLKENQIPIDLSYFNDYSCVPCDTPLRIQSMNSLVQKGSKGRWRVENLLGGVILESILSKKIEKRADEEREKIFSSKPFDSCLNWSLPDGSFAETCAVVKTKKSGNLHLDFLDILSTTTPLYFSRFYDSFNDRDLGMGIGWAFTPAYLEIPDALVQVQEVNRQASPFTFLKTASGDQLFLLKKYLPDRTLIYFSEKEGSILFFYPTETWRLVQDKEGMLFDSEGNLTQTIDPRGSTISYRYEEGLLRSIFCADGKSIDLFYKQGRLMEARGPEGQIIEYQYNLKGQLEKAGEEMAYRYDENHRLCRFFNPESFLVFEGSYDDFNRLKEEKWGPFSSTNEYDLKDQKIKRTIKVDIDMIAPSLTQEGTLGN